jgi:hypothetical protein
MKNLLLSFMLLISASILRGQLATANLDLDRDETLESGIFSKKSGFWLTTQKTTFTSSTYKLYRYNTDLSKLLWSADLKNTNNEIAVDFKNPDYAYSILQSKGLLTTSEKQFIQVKPDGKTVTHELFRDDIFDRYIVNFCSMGYFNQVWTKKKIDNELVIVKYENQTLKRSKVTIKLPQTDEKIKYGDWNYGGHTDSIMLISRHEKKDHDNIQIVITNLNSGSILQNFIYSPQYKKAINFSAVTHEKFPNGVMSEFGYDDRDLEQKGEGASNVKPKPSAFGAIQLSKDGQSLYHFGLLNFTKKTYFLGELKPEGFMVSKLNLKGQIAWQEEIKIEDSEIAKQFYKSPVYLGSLKLEEFDNSIGLSLYFPLNTSDSRNSSSMGFEFSKDGKMLGKCNRLSKMKGGFVQEAKTVVATVEDLYPCFSKTTEKMTKYIQQKKFNARYTVLTDNDSHVLIISPEDARQLGILAF